MRPDLESVWGQICSAPNKNFIQSPTGSVSYASLADLIARFCTRFDHLGFSPGDCVVIVTGEDAIAGAVFLAALLDGLVPVMLSSESRPDRIIAICNSVQPGLLVIDEAIAGELPAMDLNQFVIPKAVAIQVSQQGPIAVWRGLVRRLRPATTVTGLNLPAEGRQPRLPATDNTPAYILFTSGTTKSPSGVLISRTGVMAQLETLTRLFCYDADSRIFNATPLAHTDGLVQGLLLAVVNGATLLRPEPFSLSGLEEWLDCLVRFEATHFITNPTVLSLVDRFASHDDYFNEERFFGVLSSASILRQDFWQKFEDRFECHLYNLYGMTETVANATYAGRQPEMGPLGSIGLPVDCEVRLIPTEPSTTSQESCSEGELHVRGENVFLGYWNDPERTARTLSPDGWMRTGDLATYRNDGGLQIIGRISTVINMGGQSIMPEEIDEVLATHSAVVDVATVALSDPQFEEVAVSAVVLGLPASEQELTAHCRQRLERLKVPKHIVVVDKIPRGGAGKPKKDELQKLLETILEDAVPATATNTSGGVSAQLVYEMAAGVFQVSAAELDANSSPATVSGWDSFNQLSLMIEAELRFGIRIPASKVASIRTLGDLHQTIIANH